MEDGEQILNILHQVNCHVDQWQLEGICFFKKHNTLISFPRNLYIFYYFHTKVSNASSLS